MRADAATTRLEVKRFKLEKFDGDDKSKLVEVIEGGDGLPTRRTLKDGLPVNEIMEEATHGNNNP